MAYSQTKMFNNQNLTASIIISLIYSLYIRNIYLFIWLQILGKLNKKYETILKTHER